MAIGLGRMLGFHFFENFNYPYISTSITDFWRRWHITLSNWFREYVFYPLERRRRELPVLTQPVNILIVFLLTGLWHGITPPFILWGLLHGLALVLERGRFGAWLSKTMKPLQHLYALGVILLGWVFSVPLPKPLRLLSDELQNNQGIWELWLRNIILLLLLAAGIIVQAGALYHPFIYGEF